MKILGITAEYNPFHNGHKYHLNESMRITGADYSVAVMSGSFTQRGELAVLDKWTRSRLAVQNGVDLVLELPFLYACSRGEIFAAGAVDILAGIGVTHISFGSESGDIGALKDLVSGMNIYHGEIEKIRQQKMREGDSFARSQMHAVKNVLGAHSADLLSEPNNILAAEYLRRISYHNERGVHIIPCTVKRFGSGYASVSEKTGFAGASALRKMAGEKASDASAAGKSAGENEKGAAAGSAECAAADFAHFMPADAAQALASDGIRGLDKAKHNEFMLLQGELMKTGSAELSRIYCMGEGLENKFRKEIVKAADMDEFISSMTSKRYTESAVRRIVAYVLMGIKTYEPERKPYARVLAAGRKGRELLRVIKKNDRTAIPVITNLNKEWDNCADIMDTLRYDMLAADLYNIIHERSLYDFSDRVVRPYIEK